MASIETRRNSAGKITSYRVIWMEDGHKEAESFKKENEAEYFKRKIEKHQTYQAAKNSMLREKSSSPVFESVAETHLERLINVGPQAEYSYRGYLKNHLLPYFGSMPVDTIEEEDMIRWTKTMKQKKLKPKTIANNHGFMHGIMETALTKKWIQDNPCKGWYLPGDDSTQDAKTILSPAEFRELLPHLHEHFHAWAWFQYTTGLRPSESYVVYPEDFNLDGPVPQVRVTKALKRDPSKGWYVGPPKTQMARRTVGFPQQVADMLRPLIDQTPHGEPIFRMKRGGTATVDAMGKAAWRPAVKAALAAGFKKEPDMYALRHSHASLMIQNGMDLFTLSRRLGHESIKMTADVYSHLLPDVHLRSEEVWTRALAEDQVIAQLEPAS